MEVGHFHVCPLLSRSWLGDDVVHFRGGDNAEAQPVPRLIALLDSGNVNTGPGQDNFGCHAAALALF
ncbi:hypothetical protein ECMP0215612_2607 [Escherichia coli MP021561.2]|nr:hypothetical protein ECMP0215612_2607 [Escherichia coli MP021561.2]